MSQLLYAGAIVGCAAFLVAVSYTLGKYLERDKWRTGEYIQTNDMRRGRSKPNDG